MPDRNCRGFHTYFNYLLVESVLTPKGPRQKVICSLGDLSPRSTVFLYDVTSTFFEGKALANPKAKRGYSRDHRSDCKQVLIGLAVNRDGFPLAHEVYAGNRHDSTTLEEMLKALDRRIGLQAGQTVVVDRGMSGEENLNKIRQRQLHYLVAEPYGARREWVEEFEDEQDFEQVKREVSPNNPFQHKSTIQVKRRKQGAETHVLCVSSERRDKDRAIREAHEKKLVASTLPGPRCARHSELTR